jgi:hypothetical protein
MNHDLAVDMSCAQQSKPKTSLGLLSVLFATLISILVSCTQKQQGAGTATDAENTVAGVVVDSQGNPLKNVEVRLVTDSLGYLISSSRLSKVASSELDAQGIILIAWTDSLGRFEFPEMDSSIAYSLNFRYKDSQGAYYARLLLGLQGTEALLADSLRKIGLQRASALEGYLDYHRGTDPRYQFSNHFYATVKGTGIVYSVYAGVPFLLDGIPAGDGRELTIYPADKGMVQYLLTEGLVLDSMRQKFSLEFMSGDTLQLDSVSWSLPNDYLGPPPQDTTPKPTIRLMSGVVINYLNDPVAGAEVRLILDTFGLSYANGFPQSDSLVAITDQEGRWSLPIPSASSFNLEFMKANKSAIVGYNIKKRIKAPDLTVTQMTIDTVSLRLPASIEGMLRYTEEPDAWIQVGSHFRIGVKGTSRFIDIIAGETFLLQGLPPEQVTLVYYPGDTFLWPKFQEKLGSLVEMVDATAPIVLTQDDTLHLQVDTYTLPALLP